MLKTKSMKNLYELLREIRNWSFQQNYPSNGALESIARMYSLSQTEALEAVRSLRKI